MLAIKRQQREALGEPAFEDRTMARLQRYYGEHVVRLDDDELRFRVRHAIEKARSYGLTFESSISTFVFHMMTIHPAFDRQKAIQKALHDPDLPPDGRMTAMMGTVEDEDWEEAARQGDAEAYWAEVHRAKAKEV